MMQTTKARPSRRGMRWAAVAAALATVTACSTGVPGARAPDVPSTSGDVTPTSQTGDSPSPTADAGTATGSPAGLEQFYSQQLDWSACGSNECARLTVPIDYQQPEGETIELAVVKVAATGDRIGSIVVNPGGPGGSGVDYATSGYAVSSQVAARYDIVGFDPRGVAGSAPITCFDDRQMDTLLGADPSPDTPAERAESDQLLEDFANACKNKAGELLGHVSTIEAARDIDVLRAALGEDQLTYLGASYGTFLGATYAQLFPDKVGRLVLDGAIDPTISGLQVGLGQAEGFERATTAYLKDCVAGGDCVLGDDVDQARTKLQDFLDGLDTEPLPIKGDKVKELTEGWGLLGIIVAMYDQAGWPLLSQALKDGLDGDGTMLMFLANLYADRTSDGKYNGNGMQAIYAVNCLDRPADEEDLDTEEVRKQFEEVSPTFGKYLAGDGACNYWPVKAEQTLDSYAASGAAPIVVIGTTRDPATPYEWAQSLAKILDSGVLISYDGDGHTAYGRSNDCVDNAVDAYLIDGTVPKDGLSC